MPTERIGDGAFWFVLFRAAVLIVGVARLVLKYSDAKLKCSDASLECSETKPYRFLLFRAVAWKGSRLGGGDAASFVHG